MYISRYSPALHVKATVFSPSIFLITIFLYLYGFPFPSLSVCSLSISLYHSLSLSFNLSPSFLVLTLTLTYSVPFLPSFLFSLMFSLCYTPFPNIFTLPCFLEQAPRLPSSKLRANVQFNRQKLYCKLRSQRLHHRLILSAFCRITGRIPGSSYASSRGATGSNSLECPYGFTKNS